MKIRLLDFGTAEIQNKESISQFELDKIEKVIKSYSEEEEE